MDLSAFVRNLDEEELRALVNHSPGAGVKESPLAGQEIYRELVLLCADELARRLACRPVGLQKQPRELRFLLVEPEARGEVYRRVKDPGKGVK